MKKLKSFTLLLLTSLPFSSAVFANQFIYQEKIFEGKGSDCHLKSFKHLTVENEFINFGGSQDHDRHSFMGAIWETSSPECLKDYGVVQYIKGCTYNSTFNPKTNEVIKDFGIVRESRGRFILFRHLDWEVDSVDIDPLYSSYSEEDANFNNRFDWNQYPKTNKVLENTYQSKKYWGKVINEPEFRGSIKDSPLNQKRMMVTDFPSLTTYSPGVGLKNDRISISSLMLKTCLYRTKDIPTATDPSSFTDSLESGGPIVCFDWSNNYKANYQTKKVEKRTEIDPFCFTGPNQE